MVRTIFKEVKISVFYLLVYLYCKGTCGLENTDALLEAAAGSFTNSDCVISWTVESETSVL